MSLLVRQLESLLFALAQPLSAKQLSKLLKVETSVVEDALKQLKENHNTDTSGIHLLEQEGAFQLATHPADAGIVEQVSREELQGELTKPSLETLTIIAYRGPLTKPEIERIRGVNCTLILRHLLMRGLITQKDSKERLQPVYAVSLDFLRHLGIHSLTELPDYETLHSHKEISALLAQETEDL